MIFFFGGRTGCKKASFLAHCEDGGEPYQNDFGRNVKSSLFSFRVAIPYEIYGIHGVLKMKISTKLILIIVLGITIVFAQFVFDRFLENKLEDYEMAVIQLGKLNKNLLTAIIEEKNFSKDQGDGAYQKANQYLAKAREALFALEKGAVNLKGEKIAFLKEHLKKYRVTFEELLQQVQRLGAEDKRLTDGLFNMNKKAMNVLEKVNEEIAIALTNVEEVSETIRQLSEITKNTLIWTNRIVFVLSEDLFLRRDEKTYLEQTKKIIFRLNKEKESADILSKILTDQSYMDFIGMATKIIDQLPEQTVQIYDVWKVTQKLEIDMDQTRKKLLNEANKLSASIEKQRGHLKKQLLWINVLVLVCITAFLTIVGLLIIRSINQPLKEAISGLTQCGEQVMAASSQVSFGSRSVAEGASEQAASIEETSSSLEEMSSMTKQNAEHGGHANNFMEDVKQIVAEMNHVMKELSVSMDEISDASQETSKIIKTIDEIAFQTNLLALNAAVEAARAGEAGSGFAVVADEVRNLAIRSADAARNTSNLIESTVIKIERGTEIVSKTNEDFTKVNKSASKVAELIGEIAAASTEQAQGIDQINKAVAEMDKVVQQNAANAEESAGSSAEMDAQTENMQEIINELAVMVEGEKREK